MPTKYLGNTGTEANANLDTLPQLPGVLGALPASVVAALAAFNVVPVVASAAARDALIPAPFANQRVERSDTGYRERYTGGQWLPEGVTRAAGPVVSVRAKGAKGDGATNDAAAFTATDAAVAAGGRAEFDASASTYFINTNTTLNGHWASASKGATIKLGANITLTINGPFEAGNWKVFDTSAAGSKVVWGKQIPIFNPMWWGVVGDGVTDDKPALTLMLASIPDRCIVEPPMGLKMGLATPFVVSKRVGIRFRSPYIANGSDGATLAPQFTWLGGNIAHVPGTAGSGAMVYLEMCQHCHITGIAFISAGPNGNADQALAIDGFGASFGTQCEVAWCTFWNNSANPNFIAVAISQEVVQNQEYHRVHHCGFVGSSGIVNLNTASVTVGVDPRLFTVANTNGILAGVSRIRVAGAGVAGAMFDDTIAAIVDATHIRTVNAASTSVVNAQCIINQCFGIGILVGQSANAKGIWLYRNDFVCCKYGVKQLHGNMFLDHNNFDFCEIEVDIESSAEAGYEAASTSEGGLQHLRYYSDQGFTMRDCKVDSSYVLPNGSFMELGPNASALAFVNSAIGGTAPATTTVYGGTLSSNLKLQSMGCTYNGLTLAQLGWSGLQPGVTIFSRGDKGIADAPAKDFILGGNDYVLQRMDLGSGVAAAIQGEAESRGTTGTAVGVWGRAYIGAGFQSSTLVGGRFEAMTTGPGTGAVALPIGVQVVPPALAGGTTTNAEGIRVESPGTGGQTITNMIGLRLLAQKNAASVNGYAIKQEGASDLVSFAGQVQFGITKVESATVYIDIGAGGNATPNAAGAEEYRYRIAGAATINAPINPVKGMTFTLVIFNNTGGAITPTLNAVFLGTGFGAIGAGKSRSRRYQYDDVRAAWEPIGAVSEDF